MVTVEDRLNAYQQASTLLPGSASEMDVARLAEWLITGHVPLDHARLKTAARALATFDRNGNGGPLDYDKVTPEKQACYDGQVARVVVAYLQNREQL